MIKLNIYKSKKIGVLGLGKSGAATAKALENSGIEFICWDDNETVRQKISKYSMVPLDSSLWHDVDFIVASAGINLNHHPLAHLDKQFLADVELLYNAQPHAKYIGVTGTNGKSTTVSLIYHLLQCLGYKVECGGNIGIPALSLNEADYYVLELSSYQLSLIDKLRINYAILLNITPDHLERHGNFANYIKAKSAIFSNQTINDVAIINHNDEHIRQLREAGIIKSHIIPFSTTSISQHLITVKDNIIYDNIYQQEITFRTSLLGKHNEQNIAASYSCLKSLGVKSHQIAENLSSFQPLPHRLETIIHTENIWVINDSKATNSDSAEKALLSCQEPIFWILGGLPKSDGIRPLIYLFPKVTKAYLIGTAKYDFAQLLAIHGVAYEICCDLQEATSLAVKEALQASRKMTVLFSPACASFDEWPNFEVRGDHFRQYVRVLLPEC